MDKKIKAKVDLGEIYFDEDLYPRSSFNWQTSYDYSQSMRTGVKFPPIVLAVFNNRKYLVDGKHRIEALKSLKKNKVDAIVHIGWDKKKIFVEAVKANIAHGRVLSPYEKRKIAMKLTELKYKNSEISGLIQVPMDKLETFVGGRLINTITKTSGEDSKKEAEQIAQVIVKSGLKHYSGTTVSPEDLSSMESTQQDWNMHSQVDLLKQIIDLIENQYLDLNNPRVKELYDYLVNLIIKAQK